MANALLLAWLLPSALLAPAAARRTIAVQKGEGLYDYSERWCLTSEANPSCEKGSSLDIFSAFTSPAWRRCGLPSGSGDVHGCEPNVTDWVRSLCQGKNSCVLKPSAHPACDSPPQYSIRISWSCVEGGAEDEVEEPAEPKGDDDEHEKAEKVDVEPVCTNSNPVDADTFMRRGRLTTVCRDMKTKRFAKKACCEKAISVQRRAKEACLAVREEHCTTDASRFLKKRGKYPDVPAGYLCKRMYHCMRGSTIIGIARNVGICGSHRLEARKVCVAEKE